MYFRGKEKNGATLPHSAQWKNSFRGKIKEMSKSNKLAPRKKFSLELLHHRLGHRYTRSLMAGYNEMFWKEIELRVDPDPFFTSLQISPRKKC